MEKRTIVRFCLGLLILILAFSLRPGRFPPYARIYFVQTWTPTYCAQPDVTCRQNLEPTFTLHGLWPADADGTSLTYCSKKRSDQDIDKETIELRVDLLRVWPSVQEGKTSKSFWQFQWNKHGICCLLKLTKMDYFRAAIAQRNNIDLSSIFTYAGVKPRWDATYTKAAIENAIRGHTGTAVDVSCKPMNDTHVKLFEIYICLDVPGTNYVDCPPSGNKRGCWRPGTETSIIMFPPK
ncbi:ribonuclease 3-like [Rhododendron vialii]|uniref:ribonuclease 3-like n=1 Tax=Rhododendron vialii TaxID=182163 RepID=UPI00265F8149|nr:ribonuclease 3-like [Rhododendron vialii]